MKRVIILDPHLDQAIALAEMLHAHAPGMPVVGGCLPGRRPWRVPAPFREVIDVDPDGPAAADSVMVPTGADGTVTWLTTRGAIPIGDVVMSAAALLADDKPAMLRAAVEAGLAVPRTWHDPAAIVSYPVFYKDARESGRTRRRRGIAAGPGDLPPGGNGEFLFQEFIDSPGTWGVGFLAREGEMLTTFAHRERLSYPREGGSGVILEPSADPRLRELAARLIAHLGFSGWGLVEFKWCPRRQDYVFMELNAKFWESLAFALRGEPDFARLLFGVTVPRETLPRVVFARRFLLLPVGDQVRHLHLLAGCRRMDREPLWRAWARERLPVEVKRRLKTLLGGRAGVSREDGTP